nr:zinc-ribbon domain-containing protein [Ktedonobacteraceae bacterium]
MPLWDSVQRSLEKASQEAARIARTQRLRSTIDGLSRQINTQNNAIINKAMDLFVSGQLTQSELLPLCQEMMNLHQQLNQAQNELKQLQAQANQSQSSQAPLPPQSMPNPNQPLPPVTTEPGQVPYTTASTESGQHALYAPPPEYQSYMDSTTSNTVPPPPPGMEPLTVSAIETMRINMGPSLSPAPSQTGSRLCTVCHTEIQPNMSFCHNCGAPVQEGDSLHSPTMRAGSFEQPDAHGQATQLASADSAYSTPASQGQTNAPDPDDNQETVRANTPPTANDAPPAPEPYKGI